MNKETYQSETELKNKLKQIEEKLNDIQQLQEKYIEAFEQNLFPKSILQERLQQVSREKLQLEQNRNELNRHLSSSDAKIIDSNLIRTLMEKFVEVYKESSRENSYSNC